jgi:hypothetical protein
MTFANKRLAWRMAALLFFLLPAFLGFGNKFLEFLALVNDEEGAFTVMPILNYLLASLGFFLLLGWAMLHGMFHDIEKPKYRMLETERQLDLHEEEES